MDDDMWPSSAYPNLTEVRESHEIAFILSSFKYETNCFDSKD